MAGLQTERCHRVEVGRRGTDNESDQVLADLERCRAAVVRDGRHLSVKPSNYPLTHLCPTSMLFIEPAGFRRDASPAKGRRVGTIPLATDREFSNSPSRSDQHNRGDDRRYAMNQPKHSGSQSYSCDKSTFSPVDNKGQNAGKNQNHDPVSSRTRGPQPSQTSQGIRFSRGHLVAQ